MRYSKDILHVAALAPELGMWERGEYGTPPRSSTWTRARLARRPCASRRRETTGSAGPAPWPRWSTSKVKKEIVEARGRSEDQLTCVVCLEQPRSVVLRPCSHYVCCSACAHELEQCPSAGCDTPVRSRLQGISMASRTSRRSRRARGRRFLKTCVNRFYPRMQLSWLARATRTAIARTL